MLEVAYSDDYNEGILNLTEAIYLPDPTSLGLPLLFSGQSSWLQIQKSRVRYPALPDFSEK
jgi:hypothetical protein